MKKKLLLLTGALTVAALSVAIFAHKPMTAEEALLLKNVEAIAQNEGGGSYWLRSASGTCEAYVNGTYIVGTQVTCDPGGSDICVSCWY